MKKVDNSYKIIIVIIILKESLKNYSYGCTFLSESENNISNYSQLISRIL